MTTDTPSADEIVAYLREHGPAPAWRMAVMLRPRAASRVDVAKGIIQLANADPRLAEKDIGNGLEILVLADD